MILSVPQMIIVKQQMTSEPFTFNKKLLEKINLWLFSLSVIQLNIMDIWKCQDCFYLNSGICIT